MRLGIDKLHTAYKASKRPLGPFRRVSGTFGYPFLVVAVARFSGFLRHFFLNEIKHLTFLRNTVSFSPMGLYLAFTRPSELFSLA